jgi:hypothetical protein
MDLLNPKLLEFMMGFAEKGGLLFVCAVLLVFLSIEMKRSAAKDKIIAAKDKQNLEFQANMLVIVGELKTTMSNNVLLLELLTRGRK